MAEVEDKAKRLAELKANVDRYNLVLALSSLNIAVRQLAQGQRTLALAVLHSMNKDETNAIEQLKELDKFLADAQGYLDQLGGQINELRVAKK